MKKISACRSEGDKRSREDLRSYPRCVQQAVNERRTRKRGMSRANWNFPGADYPPPESVLIAGRVVKAGERVRLRPGNRDASRQGSLTDAIDIMLEGKIARIETIQQDFENRIYLVVTLDDDPGQESWNEHRLPGHHFFFFPEEVEPLADTVREES